MKFEIDEGVIAQAQMCDKGYGCLSGKAGDLCSVDDFIVREGKEALFVKHGDMEYCNYRIPFGMCGRWCRCPVRIEIYKRYGK